MVIILNGTSSAGKSSLARALQGVVAAPFLHVRMDTFLEMMPPRYADHPDAFAFLELAGREPAETAVETGPYGVRVMQGMRSAIAAMAGHGLNLIIDDVFLDEEQAAYDRLLDDHDVRFVRVDAALDMAERRERQRGDRDIGLARWQFTRVHRDVRYDFAVDTTHATPEDCARQIAEKFGL
tara:strand:- start:2022 stop:2564 length:543 start_codon:yes stop_codon:yes gene_type:complete